MSLYTDFIAFRDKVCACIADLKARVTNLEGGSVSGTVSQVTDNGNGVYTHNNGTNSVSINTRAGSNPFVDTLNFLGNGAGFTTDVQNIIDQVIDNLYDGEFILEDLTGTPCPPVPPQPAYTPIDGSLALQDYSNCVVFWGRTGGAWDGPVTLPKGRHHVSITGLSVAPVPSITIDVSTATPAAPLAWDPTMIDGFTLERLGGAQQLSVDDWDAIGSVVTVYLSGVPNLSGEHQLKISLSQ